MLKKLCLTLSLSTAFCITSALFPQTTSTVSAVGFYGDVQNYNIPCLNDDPNYPMVYVYHARREYIDLSSCTLVSNTKDSFEFAACYIMTDGYKNPEEVTETGTLRFKQKKDGHGLPQYYHERTQKWITIPAYHYDKISSLSYVAYIGPYHPYQYYAFKIVYNKLFGIEYADDMHGHVI